MQPATALLSIFFIPSDFAGTADPHPHARDKRKQSKVTFTKCATNTPETEQL